MTHLSGLESESDMSEVPILIIFTGFVLGCSGRDQSLCEWLGEDRCGGCLNLRAPQCSGKRNAEALFNMNLYTDLVALYAAADVKDEADDPVGGDGVPNQVTTDVHAQISVVLVNAD